MKSYCVRCRKYTKNINPIVSGTSNSKAMVLSKCVTCGSKNQEAKGLLRNLGLGDLSFECNSIELYEKS